MKSTTIFPLILAGGASSRLFPFNKILADLFGTGESLLQQAMGRAQVLADRPNIRVLAVQSMADPIARQLKLPPKQILVDPVRRGTWPAILWAMTHLPAHSSNAVMAVITGDHLIPKISAFRKAAQQAIALAADHPAFLMLGVEPNDDPQTWSGFGVFRFGKDGRVTRFAEKPSMAQAYTMIKQGQWQWNSGMFFFRVCTAVEALQRFQPDMYRIYMRICEAVSMGDRALAEKIYAEFPEKITHPGDEKRQVDNTIDFAVMTPLVSSKLLVPGSKDGKKKTSLQLATRNSQLKALAVTGGLPEWADIGQWTALMDVLKKDRWGNVRIGKVNVDRSVRNCILAADRGYTVKMRNLEHHIVAISKAGEIVLPIGKLAEIKALVQQAVVKDGRRIVRIPT